MLLGVWDKGGIECALMVELRWAFMVNQKNLNMFEPRASKVLTLLAIEKRFDM